MQRFKWNKKPVFALLLVTALFNICLQVRKGIYQEKKLTFILVYSSSENIH